MERITRDQMLMSVAQIVAQRGTCDRLQVGAVFSRDGRIIATGYNGVPMGLPHCYHEVWYPGKETAMPWGMHQAFIAFTDERRDAIMPKATRGFVWTYDGVTLKINSAQDIDLGCTRAEHAERNGVAFAARHGLKLEGSELHVTHAPCFSCAVALINAGIVRVSYLNAYRLTAGVEMLTEAGIQVIAFANKVQ